jgi:hypothetical protein
LCPRRAADELVGQYIDARLKIKPDDRPTYIDCSRRALAREVHCWTTEKDRPTELPVLHWLHMSRNPGVAPPLTIYVPSLPAVINMWHTYLYLHVDPGTFLLTLFIFWGSPQGLQCIRYSSTCLSDLVYCPLTGGAVSCKCSGGP